MLQLVGGVAAAGVVAAGATAFTAPGLTNSVATSTKVISAGSLSFSTVEGAELTSVVTLSSRTNKAEITGVRLYLAGLNSTALNTTTTVVNASITGTSAPAGSVVGTVRTLTCAYNSTPAAWDCNVTTAGTDYLTALTAVTVDVQAGV
ncbi:MULTISPECIES: hypothetical protein [unclassified Actinoplanes]|uniref:hypothetical protein n=1 Tax=unclassified Actinoplanes TaxID=2626549 RepID=UPI0012BB07F2|nr:MULTISPECIES: hypothetical protein [unclassified Actinoplanes]